MSDSKSKVPDMNEIGSIASKLFKDIKKSVDEIIADYKNKRPAASCDVTTPAAPSCEVPTKPVEEPAPIVIKDVKAVDETPVQAPPVEEVKKD